MANQNKPANNPQDNKIITVYLTNGEKAPKPNPSSQVTWEPGKPPGGIPIAKPLPASNPSPAKTDQ